MARFFSVSSSSSPPLLSRSPLLSPPRFIPSSIQFKSGCARKVVVLRLDCLSGPSKESNSEAEASSSPLSTSGSLSSYNWCVGIGGLGFLETAYLTYLKLNDSDAFCPIGGGTCGDILNSDYAIVFGVPLSLIGMVAYGLVATLGVQLAGKNLPFGVSESSGRLILLGSTTSMAAASAYFLYILNTNFTGTSCPYCLISVLLSFSLLFTTIKEFGLQEVQKVAGLQLCIAGLVVAALSTSYSTSQPIPTSMAEVNMKPFATEITTQSTPFALSLAKHLQSIGAKMYGAFWCSHCVEQKQLFGREAAKLLDYVECFPDGYRKGIKIAKACSNVGIEGFPTWVINGQVLSGELALPELAQASGFNSDEFQPS